jgi:hypothetical protein
LRLGFLARDVRHDQVFLALRLGLVRLSLLTHLAVGVLRRRDVGVGAGDHHGPAAGESFHEAADFIGAHRPRGWAGGADYPAVTVDDFTASLTLQDGRLVGTVSELVGSHEECPDGPNTCQTVTEEESPVTISLPAEFPDGACSEIGVCIVTDGQATQDDVTTNYIGTAVLKPGFWAYQLTPGHYEGDTKIIDERNPALLFAGEAYKFGEPSGRLFQFDLTQDVLQDSTFAPFASN